MKFKSLFLGMLGAAVMFSCNNDVIDNGNPTPEKPDVVEGLPVYASLNINIENGKAKTYSGSSDVGASTDEQTYTDAAMFVYKWDGVATYPQAAVYVASVSAGKVTMKTTSGNKKIFVAVNPANTDKLVPYVASGASTALTSTYTDLNNKLYSAASGWNLTGAGAGITVKADGLIKGLAKNQIKGTQAGTYTGTYNMLMTNWDGPNDVGGSTFDATCQFVLIADVDSATSNGGSSSAENFLDINVQRAFAKVALKITAAAGNHVNATGFATASYHAGDSANHRGSFQPWTASGAVTTAPATGAVWSLGNIVKETLPFQQYVGGVVRDPNYLATDDSIAQFTKWTTRYDNSRVFPTTMSSYPSSALTVGSVKSNMLSGADQWVDLTPSTGTNAYFAYATENARQAPVYHDHGTYVIIGGRYRPERVLTSIVRASVETNPPTLNYTDNYGFTVAANDTLYYIASDKVFISGLNNLKGYYAWQKGYEIDAPADFSTFTALTTDAINAARENDLYAYFEGQCWYRVFITDNNEAAASVNSLRRNHIYVVNINEIKGPGIADPNKILVPGQPIPELDTYVTANITVLDWHQVDQVVQVDQN